MGALMVGSLFSGYGGLDLAVEAGLAELGAAGDVVWQAEKEPYCRAVLKRHWPDAHRYEDVHDIDDSAARIDIACGGFPCQDISIANARGAGLDGARSGLWSEYVRVVRLLRPGLVLVENVPELLAELGRVLGPLAELGYNAEWDLFDAAAVGAPHRRERLFILAHAPRVGREGWLRGGAREASEALANADGGRRKGRRENEAGAPARHRTRTQAGPESAGPSDRWATEPDVGRVVDGTGTRLDARRRRARIRCLGNGVVPQQGALAFVTLARRAGLTEETGGAA